MIAVSVSPADPAGWDGKGLEFALLYVQVPQELYNMSISLTELRQKLFQLADRVVETGEPLTITRKGVKLRLVRDEYPPTPGGFLARLKKRKAWIGPPPDPHFSPAQWSGEPLAGVMEPAPPAYLSSRKVKRKRK